MARSKRGLSNAPGGSRKLGGRPSMIAPGDGKVSKPVNRDYHDTAAGYGDAMQEKVGGGSLASPAQSTRGR